MLTKLTTALVGLALVSAASANVVVLTPDLINQGDTSTTFYSDADLTLTPFIGNTPATFNDNASRLGIDDQGTNGQAFNDPDTDPNNGNEEGLQFEFSSNAGLTQIGWDFSRAATISISGFLADPGASFSGQFSDPNAIVPDLSAQYDSVSGTLTFSLPFNIAFGNNDGFLDLNAAASAGATLFLTVTDTAEAGAQLAITTLSYENDVPAPASAGLALIVAGTLMGRRRLR